MKKVGKNWKMSEEQLREMLREIEEEKAAKEANKKTQKLKVQREFAKVKNELDDNFRHIVIAVKGIDTGKAAEYVDELCKKMTEMDNEFKCEYKALKCPDIDEESMSYVDMIAFPKEKGIVAAQRKHVGKLMTEALIALKK